MKQLILAMALLFSIETIAPAQEQIRATPHKHATRAPAREKPVDMSVLPVSCETVRWYVAHMPKSWIDAMQKKYPPTPAQLRAGNACLRGGK